MNKQQLLTKLTLEALDASVPPNNFDERLIVQKAIYLAKAAGHDCGYYFRWYLRGPYSPELTRDVFSIKADIDADLDESSGWTLDPDSVQRLRRVRRLIPPGDSAQTAQKLELLASAHYLVHRGQVPRADPGAVRNLLAKYEKNFTEDEVAVALSELHENGLLES